MTSTFVDTSVLVYAYDADAGVKHVKAQKVLRDCWETESGCISTQVLQEFYVTVTRKLSKTVSPKSAREVIQTYRAWPVYRPTIEDVISASELQERHSLSFWNALIIISAQTSGATILMTEDLQDGRQIGSLKIINPLT